jgi:formylglycine-generating enzyme
MRAFSEVICCLVAVVVSSVAVAQADVFNMAPGLTSLETVPVGDPGNIGELSGTGAGGYGSNRICGAVAYDYRIGKYEVTAGQYTVFLNAVAKTDTYGLYNPMMWADNYGCKIQRTGESDNYTYSVAADRANRPVDFVSWGDAARFANWLHNSQPGLVHPVPQDANSTEDGAYHLDGAITNAALAAVVRQVNWKWAISNEDEWYKAAYYKGGGTNAGYWDYATRSDTPPNNVLATPTDPGNSATYYVSPVYTLGSPYYRTEAGAHENSSSPYGTFDQCGNAWEWNESITWETMRGIRGGAYYNNAPPLSAARRYDYEATFETSSAGFRVVSVPEPSTFALLLIVAIGPLACIWRKRRTL